MEKKALGRGLGALIPGAGRDERPGVIELPLDQISFNPYQPRKSYDDEKFQELVKSVRVHGILQPIVVRQKGQDQYELVAGERRLRAASEAGLARIPAVSKQLTNEQSLEVSLIENIQREDIGPLEAAHAYRRLIEEFNLSQDDISFKLGKSRPSVANTLRLLNLPQEMQDSLAKGELTEGHARALLSIAERTAQKALWQQAIRESLSVRDLERLARELRDGVDGISPQERIVSRETLSPTTIAPIPKDPNLLEVEDGLRRLFGTKVSVVKLKDRGRIEVEFYSDDDLERILAFMFGFSK